MTFVRRSAVSFSSWVFISSLVLLSAQTFDFLYKLPKAISVFSVGQALEAFGLAAIIAIALSPIFAALAFVAEAVSRFAPAVVRRIVDAGASNAPPIAPVKSVAWAAGAAVVIFVVMKVTTPIALSIPELYRYQLLFPYPIAGFVALAAYILWIRNSNKTPGFWPTFVGATLYGLSSMSFLGTVYVPHKMGFVLGPILLVACILVRLRVKEVRGSLSIVAVALVAAAWIFGAFYPSHRASHALLVDETTFSYPGLQTLRAVTDYDFDGYSGWFDSRDCAPFDPEIHIGALELPDNGIDENCNGSDGTIEIPVPIDKPTIVTNKRNVIFVTVDTMRFDAPLRKLDNKLIAPRVHQFGRENLNFSAAFSASTHTNEAVPSLFSGTYPSDWYQGGLYFGVEPPLPRILKENGYETFGVISIPYVNMAMFDGFQTVDNALGVGADGTITSERITTRALKRIDARDKSKPFFSWIHYYDPHAANLPVQPGEEPVSKNNTVFYWQEIKRVDDAFGQLLDGLKAADLYDETIIVFTSDHGESFGEHDIRSHMWKATSQIIRVPLIIRIPGTQPRAISVPASTIDIVPTIATYLAVEDLSFRDGISLKPWIDGEQRERPTLFFEATKSKYKLVRGLVHGEHKFWYDWQRDAYYLHDIYDDPQDARNLIEVKSEVESELRNTLWSWWDRQFGLPMMYYRAARWKSGQRKPVDPPEYEGPDMEGEVEFRDAPR